MKKMLAFAALLIVVLGSLAFINTTQKKDQMKDSPYGDKELRPETLKQLDDPNYKNQIPIDTLKDILAKEEDATIYFFSPTCGACQQTSPILVPLAKEMGIDLKLFNLLEYKDNWGTFNIEKTPTIVRYKKGKEVDRIVGLHSEADFKAWLEKTK
jgi:thiol-disulfide isomerase/thioredoxin